MDLNRNLIKADEMLSIGEFRPKFFIMGSSGAGKTTALRSLPSEWKILVLDLFGNKESLEGCPNIEILSYSMLNPKDAFSFIQISKDKDEITELMTGSNPPWDAICLDTVTGLLRFIEVYILATFPEKKGIGGAPAEHHYRGLSHVSGEFLMSFIGLPCATIINAHSEPLETSGGGVIGYQAIMSGKRWRNTIYSYVGEVYRAFGEPGEELDAHGDPKTEYFWQTQPDDMWPHLKSVMNQMGKYWGKYVDPNYNNLLRRRGVIE